jgi:hypothetical protein
MEEADIQNVVAYASRRQLHLAERLGFSIIGIIYVAEGKSTGGKTAIKHGQRGCITRIVAIRSQFR